VIKILNAENINKTAPMKPKPRYILLSGRKYITVKWKKQMDIKI